MGWSKPLGNAKAKLGNEDLQENFRFDEFLVSTNPDGTHVTERELKCDLTVQNENAPDETKGFKITDALTSAKVTQLKSLLAECRDYGLPLMGYIQS